MNQNKPITREVVMICPSCESEVTFFLWGPLDQPIPEDYCAICQMILNRKSRYIPKVVYDAMQQEKED